MSRKPIKRLTLFLVLFLLQFICFPYFSFHGAIPDLMAILIVVYAYAIYRWDLFIFAFLIGLTKDFVSYDVFGLEAISLSTASLVLYYLVHRLNNTVLLLKVLLVAIFKSLSLFVYILLAIWFNWIDPSFGLIQYDIMPTLFYTVLISPLVIFFLDKIVKRMPRQYRLF